MPTNKQHNDGTRDFDVVTAQLKQQQQNFPYQNGAHPPITHFFDTIKSSMLDEKTQSNVPEKIKKLFEKFHIKEGAEHEKIARLKDVLMQLHHLMHKREDLRKKIMGENEVIELKEIETEIKEIEQEIQQWKEEHEQEDEHDAEHEREHDLTRLIQKEQLEHDEESKTNREGTNQLEEFTLETSEKHTPKNRF